MIRLIGGDLLPRCEPVPTTTATPLPPPHRRPRRPPRTARGSCCADDGSTHDYAYADRSSRSDLQDGQLMSSNAAAGGTAFPSPPGGFAPPAPVQSTRRNMELLLLGFAVIITTVSLLLVEASQEQKITLDLAKYALAYTGLFLIAHLAIRRYAPYADPLLLPIVALLNGLGWCSSTDSTSPTNRQRSTTASRHRHRMRTSRSCGLHWRSPVLCCCSCS